MNKNKITNKLLLMGIFLLVYIQMSFASKSEISYWINLKPGGLLILSDSSMLNLSFDANLAFRRNLLKISCSYSDEDFPVNIDFISPSLKLKSFELSYGYIFNTGKIMYNINFAIGISHYIMRGDLLPDTSKEFMSWNFSRNYEKIENTAMIIKFPAYVQYHFTDIFSLGLFFSPFIIDKILGLEGGLVVSIGKMWSYY
jgi:hypothetical protein